MAVIIMGSVHGTCQRVNATPLMIEAAPMAERSEA